MKGEGGEIVHTAMHHPAATATSAASHQLAAMLMRNLQLQRRT